MLRQPLCETLEWIDLSANPIRDSQPATQQHGQASIQELLFEGISTLRVLDGRDRDGKEVFEGVEFEGEQPPPEQKENPMIPKWMQESQRQEEMMQGDNQYSDDEDDDYDDEVDYNENEEEVYEEDID